MSIIECVAILILVLAILFLIYYYIQNHEESLNLSSTNVKNFFESGRNFAEGGFNSEEGGDGEKRSAVDKIKYSFKDIDMASALNTDAFSKKLDAFLDEKSEELIENWSLATVDDLSSIEERCELACNNIDDLEKRFGEYSTITNEKIDDLDNRLKNIEKSLNEE